MEAGLQMSPVGTVLCKDLSKARPTLPGRTFSLSGTFPRFEVPSPDQLIEGSKVSKARVPIIVKAASTVYTEPDPPKFPVKPAKSPIETSEQIKIRLNKPYTTVFSPE